MYISMYIYLLEFGFESVHALAIALHVKLTDIIIIVSN